MAKTGLCVLALLLASCLWAQDYDEDSEQGLGDAASYHPAPDAPTVELGTNAPASGKCSNPRVLVHSE